MTPTRVASCTAVFTVTPQLSLHKRHSCGESLGATLKTAADEATTSAALKVFNRV